MSNSNNISCEDVLKHLFAYLDRELDAHQHDEVERHLRHCRACYSRAEFEKRLKGKLQTLNQEQIPEALEQRVRKLLERY